MLQTLRDERGRIVGYFYGCSRGRTAPICKACRRGTSVTRCVYTSRQAGKCDAHLCIQCVTLNERRESFCPQHRERAGLGPTERTARMRLARKRRAERLARPPRWIPSAYRPGVCKVETCRRETRAGERILYFPDRTIMCEACGLNYREQGGAIGLV